MMPHMLSFIAFLSTLTRANAGYINTQIKQKTHLRCARSANFTEPAISAVNSYFLKYRAENKARGASMSSGNDSVGTSLKKKQLEGYKSLLSDLQAFESERSIMTWRWCVMVGVCGRSQRLFQCYALIDIPFDEFITTFTTLMEECRFMTSTKPGCFGRIFNATMLRIIAKDSLSNETIQEKFSTARICQKMTLCKFCGEKVNISEATLVLLSSEKIKSFCALNSSPKVVEKVKSKVAKIGTRAKAIEWSECMLKDLDKIPQCSGL